VRLLSGNEKKRIIKSRWTAFAVD